MALPMIVDGYLQRHHLRTQLHHHPAAYTAHQLALLEHMPDAGIAKTVFVFVEDEMMMAVLPADRHLNLHMMRRNLDADDVRLASEREIAQRINALDLGAIPPFGSMFNMQVVMDEALADELEIEVAAGRQTDSLTLRMEDYLREERPCIIPLSRNTMRFARKPRVDRLYDY